VTFSLRYSARSARGYFRDNNENAVYAGPRLLALADGMGGHVAGEVAASLAIRALAPLDERAPGDDLIVELAAATARANEAIARDIADHPEHDGMGTTLTAILVAGDRAALVHVGASRAYMLRAGSLRQITTDDTYVQSLIDEGRIAPEEAWDHPQRALVLRALTGQELHPSHAAWEPMAGDRYMLCSDGLSDVLPTGMLAETLRIPDPQQCTGRLVDLALRADSRDNVTCIVADVVGDDSGYDIPIVGGAASREGVLIGG
jgi:protein phosphatase